MNPEMMKAIRTIIREELERAVYLMRRPAPRLDDDLAVLATGGVDEFKALCHAKLAADNARKGAGNGKRRAAA